MSGGWKDRARFPPGLFDGGKQIAIDPLGVREAGTKLRILYYFRRTRYGA
jgi:hypothetical protein